MQYREMRKSGDLLVKHLANKNMASDGTIHFSNFGTGGFKEPTTGDVLRHGWPTYMYIQFC